MNVRDTSAEAFHQITGDGRITEQQQSIYRVLFKHGPMTATEVFKRLEAEGRPVNYNTRTRFGEMRDLGILREARKRPCSITKRKVIEWEVTGALPAKIEKPVREVCPHCRRPWSH